MPQLFLHVQGPATPLYAHSSDDVIDAGLESNDQIDAHSLEASTEPSATSVEYRLQTHWLILENDGSIRAQGVSSYHELGELIDPSATWLSNPQNVIVIVPSQHALTLQCQVPGKNVGQIRRALPFAAEEFVASDIELMHIAHAPIKAGQPVRCNIVEQNILEDWLASLASLGLTPGYLLTETDLLPWGTDQVAVLFQDERVLVGSREQAVEIDATNLAFALEALPAQRLISINGEPDEITLGQLDPKPEVECITAPNGVLAYFAEQFERALANQDVINILQGYYQPVKASNPSLKLWRSVAALAAVWAVVGFLGMAVQAWWAGQEADRLTAESFAFYGTNFKSESKPVSIQQLRRRVNAKLGRPDANDATGSSDFIGLMAHFANVVDNSSQVASLNYQREELSVEVMLASYDDLNPIKDKLGGVGVEVNVTSAEQDEQQVRARLRLKYLE
ncbi:MAG: type II secretion system protein GspL [Pseudomonadota bacterium]